MGRRKIPIERKETLAERQLSFGKRHAGLLKKAYELSVLCDVDVALIMYSPKDNLCHFSSKSSNTAKVIQGLVQHLQKMPEAERARLQLPQDIINKINITAAQDEAANQPGPDAAIREEIERKNIELRLLQETKRMVCPAMETLYSLSEREQQERSLEERLSAIVDLKREVHEHHQLQRVGMGYPSSSSVQVQPQERRNWDSSHGGGGQLRDQPAVSAGGMGYPSSSSVQVQPQARRNWDSSHGGGGQLRDQLAVSAGGMGYPSQKTSLASLEADLETHEAVQQALSLFSVDSSLASIF